ncbi:hypothetical protein GCM10023063_11880 [Arthrobacter methylotrophus]
MIARRLVVAGSIAFVAWLIVAFQLFFNVPVNTPHRTDAVIMLGGASSERLPVAEKLKSDLGIPVLAVSHTGTPGNVSADELCNTLPRPDPSLVCLTLDENDTRGEARAIGKLVAEKGWGSVTVVTSRYHQIRAGTLISQCTTADVQMFASDPELSAGQWLRRFAIETGGLLDALLRPECDSR